MSGKTIGKRRGKSSGTCRIICRPICWKFAATSFVSLKRQNVKSINKNIRNADFTFNLSRQK